ncbi:BgTH12-04334 [Blumeria graminis f. sp. triticale]|uniref:BgTH12-04334 n=1 Tax=Blumeria graminis f. sp. triticale TaxID=1689686 RepID=A0A9W4CUD3_BLUGR|nr:BgTH12-04334 [Blumeria graminis f. sp. triticale]
MRFTISMTEGSFFP